MEEKLFEQVNISAKQEVGIIWCGSDDVCASSDGYCMPWAH